MLLNNIRKKRFQCLQDVDERREKEEREINISQNVAEIKDF